MATDRKKASSFLNVLAAAEFTSALNVLQRTVRRSRPLCCRVSAQSLKALDSKDLGDCHPAQRRPRLRSAAQHWPPLDAGPPPVPAFLKTGSG